MKEKLDFLHELGKKMNAQDNRGTQFPLFVVRQRVRKYNYNQDGEFSERLEDYDEDSLCEKCEKLADEGDVLPDECDDCESSSFVRYDLDYEFDMRAGVFFTEEACDAHIKANHYHYHEPSSYAIGAWRNWEMQKMLQIVSELGSERNEARDCYR